jgi:hypothetical protein
VPRSRARVICAGGQSIPINVEQCAQLRSQFQRIGRHRRRLWTQAEDARITARDRPAIRKLSKAMGQRRLRISAEVAHVLSSSRVVTLFAVRESYRD